MGGRVGHAQVESTEEQLYVIDSWNDSGERNGGEFLVFISVLFSFCCEQKYTGNHEHLIINL